MPQYPSSALKLVFKFCEDLVCNLSIYNDNDVIFKVRQILEVDNDSNLRYQNKYTLNQLHFIKVSPAASMVALVENKDDEIYNIEYDEDFFFSKGNM